MNLWFMDMKAVELRYRLTNQQEVLETMKNNLKLVGRRVMNYMPEQTSVEVIEELFRQQDKNKEQLFTAITKNQEFEARRYGSNIMKKLNSLCVVRW